MLCAALPMPGYHHGLMFVIGTATPSWFVTPMWFETQMFPSKEVLFCLYQFALLVFREGIPVMSKRVQTMMEYAREY